MSPKERLPLGPREALAELGFKQSSSGLDAARAVISSKEAHDRWPGAEDGDPAEAPDHVRGAACRLADSRRVCHSAAAAGGGDPGPPLRGCGAAGHVQP